MNVLACTRLYPPTTNAGAELMLHSLLRDLASRGNRCAVALVRGRCDDYTLDGIDVSVALPAWAPDVVIGQIDGREAALTLARKHGARSVLLAHGDRQFGGRWDLVVSNTAAMLPIAHRYHHPSQVIVVWPPVFRADYEVETTGEYVTLMNLQHAKGADVFYRLADLWPGRRFLAVGGGWGQQVVRHADNVVYQPHTANPRDDVYARTRVLLMPSKAESFGRVAVEAAMSGIPTIAPRLPGVVEAMGEDGCVWADNDCYADALACLDDAHEYAGHSALAVAAAARHEYHSGDQLDQLAEVLCR